jgi:hypothetical protein
MKCGFWGFVWSVVARFQFGEHLPAATPSLHDVKIKAGHCSQNGLLYFLHICSSLIIGTADNEKYVRCD